MITVVGGVFLIAYAVASIAGARYLLWVLAASLPFTHVAAVVVDTNGISPFWVGGLFAAARLIWLLRSGSQRAAFRRFALWGANLALLVAAAYSTLVTAIGAGLFRGLGVYAPRGGIDEQLAALTPLDYSISNVAQIVYLALGIVIVLWMVVENPMAHQTFEIAITITLALTLWHMMAPQWWPNALFDNNPTYHYMSREMRERGPFSEPSALGMFAAAAIAYVVSAFSRVSVARRLCYAAVVALSLVVSAAASAGTALITLACLAVVAIALLGWRVARARSHRQLVLMGSVALVVATVTIVGWGAIAPYTVDLVATKLVSDSLNNRNASNDRAWQILLETWGIGVGLGGNRPSSFLFMLLSCVGLVGTALLLRAVAGYVGAAFRAVEYRPTAWALTAVLIAHVVAVPDLSTPLLWFMLAVAAQAYARGAVPVGTDGRRIGRWASLVVPSRGSSGTGQ